MHARARRSRIDIEALYHAHGAGLLSWFVRRSGDTQTALDLWAETFAQAIASQAGYRGRSDGEAISWLYGIARNLLASYHRRGKAELKAVRKLRLERPVLEDRLLAEIERRAGLAQLHEEVAAALAMLSPGVREVVRLRVVDGRAYDEIARSLSISQQAARARVSRGLHALALAMESGRLEDGDCD